MILVEDTSQQELVEKLLDELDQRAEQERSAGAVDTEQACRRSAPRDLCRAACVVRFLCDRSGTIAELEGRTRNLSRGGVGLVLRRMFVRGDPIEVEVKLADRPSLYLAGLVAACRYAGSGLYEVGVSLRVAQARPVFSHAPDWAADQYEWLHLL